MFSKMHNHGDNSIQCGLRVVSYKSSCAQAGLLLGVLLQHGGDDDQLRGVRHACVPPLLLLHRQIPHHGHHHPWGGPPSGTTILEIF